MANRGRLCEEHTNCGVVPKEGVVVCLHKLHVLVEGKEEGLRGQYSPAQQQQQKSTFRRAAGDGGMRQKTGG